MTRLRQRGETPRWTGAAVFATALVGLAVALGAGAPRAEEYGYWPPCGEPHEDARCPSRLEAADGGHEVVGDSLVMPVAARRCAADAGGLPVGLEVLQQALDAAGAPSWSPSTGADGMHASPEGRP